MEHFSIRVRYTAGPARHDDAAVAIGTYSNASTRDMEITRLSRLVAEGSPWAFEPYDQDAHGCDLWAHSWRVIQATHQMRPGELDTNPDAVLRLFNDGTGEGHGWYHIIHDGDWVDARELHTYSPDDVATAADGASTTVGALVDLAFGRFDLEPGQTEAVDPLRLHLLAKHKLCNATTLTDAEAAESHEHEHTGPGTIRNHDRADLAWDYSAGLAVLVEVDTGDDDDEDGATFAAHMERHRCPGQGRTKPWTKAPQIYEETTQYTVCALPPDDPWRRHYEIKVERRGDGKWTVNHSGMWTDADGNWDVPFSGPHVPRYLFELDDALALARKLAETVECNERTAIDVLNLPREGRR